VVLILVAAGGYGAWFLYWQQDPGNRQAPPGIEGLTETVDVLYVKMDVQIKTPTWDWNEMKVDIIEHSISRDIQTVPVSILSKYGYWSTTHKGELTVRIKDSSGVISDAFTKSFELTDGYFNLQEEKTIPTDWIKVGQVDSGQYTVEAIIIDDTGDVVETEKITISS